MSAPPEDTTTPDQDPTSPATCHSLPESNSPETRRRQPAIASLSWIILVAAFTAGAALILLDRPAAAETNTDIRQFAEEFSTTLIGISATDIDRQISFITGSSSGQFLDEFRGTSKDLANLVHQSNATSLPHISAITIRESADNRYEALVVATSTVSNAAGADGESRFWRLRLQIHGADGFYKVEQAEIVP